MCKVNKLKQSVLILRVSLIFNDRIKSIFFLLNIIGYIITAALISVKYFVKFNFVHFKTSPYDNCAEVIISYT